MRRSILFEDNYEIAEAVVPAIPTEIVEGMIEEGEDVVKDESVIEVTEEFNIDSRIITKASLLALSQTDTEKGAIITVSWLCKAKDGKMFSLCTNYLADNDEELETLNDLPFHDCNTYISHRSVVNMIMSEHETFVTDMHFSKAENDEFFTIRAMSIGDEREEVIFRVPGSIFASFVYIDNYIGDEITNNYELNLAIVSAIEPGEENAEVLFVDKIDSILALAPTDRRSTTVATVFKVIANGNQVYTILSSFNTGVKFKRDKYKGNSVEKIENTYFVDFDQYISSFMSTANIRNLDKEYMIIKAINKNNTTKLFFIDTTNKQILENMINEF